MESDPHRRRRRAVIGWREWVALPQLGIAAIKPKVDTGARSSSLQAFRVEEFRRQGTLYVRFCVHPIQRSTKVTITAEAEVLDYRNIKSSSGQRTLRPVIVTDVEVLGQRWPIELTLANRDEMGFRMLLGREAVRGRFLVDAGTSYYGGRLKKTHTSAESARDTGRAREARTEHQPLLKEKPR